MVNVLYILCSRSSYISQKHTDSIYDFYEKFLKKLSFGLNIGMIFIF